MIDLQDTILPDLILNNMRREAERFESLSKCNDPAIASMARAEAAITRAEIKIAEEHGFDALNKIFESKEE